jgi:hypothetical protein
VRACVQPGARFKTADYWTDLLGMGDAPLRRRLRETAPGAALSAVDAIATRVARRLLGAEEDGGDEPLDAFDGYEDDEDDDGTNNQYGETFDDLIEGAEEVRGGVVGGLCALWVRGRRGVWVVGFSACDACARSPQGMLCCLCCAHAAVLLD